MVKDGQIYIRGYPRDTKEDDLRDAFKDFGEIIEVKMVTPAYSFIVSVVLRLDLSEGGGCSDGCREDGWSIVSRSKSYR